MAHTRFKFLTIDEMSTEQRRIAERAMSGPTRKRGGGWNVFVRSVGVAGPLEQLGEYVRFKSDIPQRLKELVIVIMARRLTAQYAWSVHYPAAIKTGISVSALDQIAAGQRPTDLQPDETVIYDFCVTLLEGKNISDATFASVVDEYGESGLVDLLALMGYYFILGMALTVDKFPPVEGNAPVLMPLAG
ncbi:MAG: carboxymuconolactone decarboxylase family protein [Betaproteobacteria bacterium]|nr:carboxymuconolactone decarboxylase family protein [Betaproteobacteria bacterium]